MSYRIVYPVAMPIDGADFRDAVKRFVKLNHFMNIEQIILADQYNHMKANVKYYDSNNRRKASIQLFPIDPSAIPAVVGFSSTNPKAPYPAFAVGPSMVGGPAGIISPARVMVQGPAMIGGPVIGGPMIGGPMMGPMVGIPGGPGVAGVIYGARSAETSSEEIIRIDEINSKLTATTKDGSTFPILKIEKVNNNQYKVSGPGGRTSMITTEIEDGDRIVFINKKYKPDDEENMFDITDNIDKTSSASAAPSSSSSSSSMTFGPTAIVTPNRQIIQVGPVQPIGTDGRPVRGVAVPFGVPGVAPLVGPRVVPRVAPRVAPAVAPGRVIGMFGAPRVAVGGPVAVAAPVRFGRGVY